MSQNVVDAAVAEHDLVAVGQGEHLGEAVAQLADRELHGRLAVARAQVGRRRPRSSAFDGLGADLGRAAAEAPVGGQQVGGDGDGGQRVGHRCQLSRPSPACGEIGSRRAPNRYRIGAEGPARRTGASVAGASPSPPCTAPNQETHDPRPNLPPSRRHHRIRHAGRRRPGQGPARPPASRSSASAPASPTSRRPSTSSRPPSRACRDPRNHRYSPAGGLPELKEAIAAKTLRDSGYEVLPGQVLVTNGGKHAVYNTFEALLNPGDEVLLPAPYWTTYPEPIALAGGASVVLPTDESTGFRVTVDQLEAARTPGHQGAGVRVAVEPDGRGLPRGRGAGHRRVGGRARHLGRHRRDLRAPHLRRPPRSRSMPTLVPELADTVRRAQRRGQDLRHDRLAGRLDDRPGRRHQGRHQPAVAHHVERGQRVAAGRAGRGRRRPRRGGR